MAYEALTFKDVSGLLIVMSIAYATATAALLAEACYSKWRPTSSSAGTQDAALCYWQKCAGDEWALTCARHGTDCLPQRLRLHVSATRYNNMIAALSRSSLPPALLR